MVKNLTNRKEYIEGEYLPDKLIKQLQDKIFNDTKLQYPTKNNFLQCVAIIYYHQVTQAIGLNNYVPLGSTYWSTVFGGNYHEAVLEPLLEKYKIIESEKVGSRTFPDKNVQLTKGKPKGDVYIRYRINPEYLDESFTFIPYINRGKVSTAMESTMLGKQKFIIPDVLDLNFRVSIDINVANKWIENNAEQICNEFLKPEYVQSLPEGLQIHCREYLEKGSYNAKYRTVRTAKFIAESRNQELFFFNDTFYIANIEEFLKQRIPALIYHYKHEIAQVGTLPIVEKQSPVTLRIYSHLTNFPSKILQFIHINNRTVVQLDLRTSQFLIFANLINVYIKNGEQHLLSLFKQGRNRMYLNRIAKVLKQHVEQLPKVSVDINDRNSGEHSSSDVTKFIRDVFFRDFYTVVQQELGLQERMLAKNVLFKLLFKKTNRPDALLDKLYQLYPIVMNIIAEFKKTDIKTEITNNDYDKRESNFSVFLQCIEAEIFVDNILNHLRKDGIPCFTRHDSIVVAEGYQEKAETIAKNVFHQFGFKYNHKVEDKFWESVDIDELEDSTYMQWLTDEDLLTTNYDADDGFAEPVNDAEEIDMDEYEIDICIRLRDIGKQDDYFEYVNADFLEEITLLPFLNQTERNILYDDIINLRDGFGFLQDSTNQLLNSLLEKVSGIYLPEF